MATNSNIETGGCALVCQYTSDNGKCDTNTWVDQKVFQLITGISVYLQSINHLLLLEAFVPTE